MSILKYILPLLTVFLFSCINENTDQKTETLDYKISNGQFETSEGVVPPACFGQLIIELNGDDTVAAIYLGRTVLRGSIDANLPYPGGHPDDISYTIHETLPNHVYKIIVRENVDGSMGASLNKILIQFVNRNYHTEEGDILKVLSVEKLGEW